MTKLFSYLIESELQTIGYCLEFGDCITNKFTSLSDDNYSTTADSKRTMFIKYT